MYFEEGPGRIYLAGRCYGDTIACAHADEALAPDIADHLLKVEIEGDRIIFTNHRFRIEKRLDELKVEVTDDESAHPNKNDADDRT